MVLKRPDQTTYIALFRGINVGGKNILPMKGLVEILKELGLEKIRTYIQSGNAIFQTKKGHRNKIAEEISLIIRERYGFEPKIILLESADLQEAIGNNPFQTTEGKTLHFFFLDSLPRTPDMERLASLKSNSEEFKLIKNIFYLYAPNGIGRSPLAAKIEQGLGVPATARNRNTVSKLLSMSQQI